MVKSNQPSIISEPGCVWSRRAYDQVGCECVSSTEIGGTLTPTHKMFLSREDEVGDPAGATAPNHISELIVDGECKRHDAWLRGSVRPYGQH